MMGPAGVRSTQPQPLPASYQQASARAQTCTQKFVKNQTKFRAQASQSSKADHPPWRGPAQRKKDKFVRGEKPFALRMYAGRGRAVATVDFMTPPHDVEPSARTLACSCGREVAVAASRRAFWRREAERLRCRYERANASFSSSDDACATVASIATAAVDTSAPCTRCANPAVEAKLVSVEEQALQWRKEAGRLSCQYEGRGPTGGFCMATHSQIARGTGRKSPNAAGLHRNIGFSASLAVLFANASVLDLGCGQGSCESCTRRAH